jgi:Tfp pilus assembly protein PilO
MAALVLVPLVIIWPNAINIKGTADAIYAEYTFLEDQYRRGHDVRRAERDVVEAKEHIERIQALSLASGDELTLITEIEKNADLTGVRSTLRLDEEKGNTLPFSLQVTGTYYAVQEYLVALQKLPMLLSFTRVSLTPSVAERGAAQTTNISATLSGYVHKTVE